MTYVLPLTISLVVFTLILCVLLILLYLNAVKQMRESYTRQAEALSTTLEIQLRLAQASASRAEDQQSAAAKQQAELVSSLLSETVTSLEANQQLTVKTVDLMATRATSGLQQINQQTNDTLRSVVTLLGTKDPVAYQMVRGASLPGDDDLEPYTSADEVAEQRAKLAALTEAEQYLRSMGVTEDGAAGVGPHTGDIPL